MHTKPVFFDPTGHRGSFLSWTIRIGTVVVALVGVIFIVLLTGNEPPLLGDLRGHAKLLFEPLQPHAAAAVTNHALTKSAARVAAELRRKEHDVARLAQIKSGRSNAAANTASGRSLAVGFYANWDETSFAALKKDLPHLDWVIPSWLSLQGKNDEVHNDLDHRALALIKKEAPGKPIFPMIQNSVEGKWDGVALAKWLADPAKRAQHLKDIVAFLEFNELQGLTVDFESVPESAQADLKTFLKEMRDAFKPRGWSILLTVPFDDPSWDYVGYSHIVDYMVLMAYDEHWEEGASGSIAGQSWFENLLDKRMKELDPDHTIIALGGYGYDWAKGKQAEDLTFQDVTRLARSTNADIDFDPDAENPHFTYKDKHGVPHDVWFLDGVTAFNEVHASDIYRPVGYAVWRLGSEDPSIWSVLGRPYGAAAPDALKVIPSSRDVNFDGEGEILHFSSEPSDGQRHIELDPETGDIVDQNYLVLPTSFEIQRFGASPKKVALTFDDGPDPTWTPKILDILKEKNVKATFFIIGENAGAYPEIVRREFAEGHDIGNHTFTHPNLVELPLGMAKLEINATRKLFEAITGHSMRLFRAPFLGDSDPTTYDELEPVALAQKMGFVTVGLRIDPDDWLKPPPQTIIDRVLKQLADKDPDATGSVILLHDAGGDRAGTAAALPGLIDALRAHGYDIVPVRELAGLTPEQVNPALPPGMFAPLVNRSVFLTLGWVGHLLQSLFIGAIWLGFGRVIFLCALGLVHWWKEQRRAKPSAVGAQAGMVSVIVPAFNEAKVIAQSVRRILASSYPELQVIVVDDGSTDGTSAIVAREFGTTPNVRLITAANAGKANALNLGLAAATGSVVVALDADTQFEPDTISKLARWFADPEIGGVAGNAKVGNRINTITRWQALEYVSAQNLERRALDVLHCITVVPGAVGAWRRSVLDQLGGFPVNTLAEDQDLTIAVQKSHYRVIFDSEAVAWTEAPDTVKGLVKQRFRWAYGTLQCLWKHRGLIFKPRFGALGMIALPQVLLFQVFLAIIAPLVDFMLVWQILRTGLDYLQHKSQFNPDSLIITLAYFLAFMATDFAAVALAFIIERNENWRLMLWLGLQRLGYRQILYYVVVKSVVKAMFGPLVGWGKLDRKATVSLPLTDRRDVEPVVLSTLAAPD
jgi:cellulose synthase/poly-beta-1,6-N-acetylglucosamine synthase-like glycosyltransferase/peptidoglycan/xylan/chitin deacetylase (PgdA/CDA1 family)/spore germination protein YaaH